MHHEDIKASIRKSGTSPAAIARSLQVTSTTVSNVIKGNTKSARIARRICEVTGKGFRELWPGKYPIHEFAERAAPMLAKVSPQQAEADLARMAAKAKAPARAAGRGKAAV